jgi:hypothetical protein
MADFHPGGYVAILGYSWGYTYRLMADLCDIARVLGFLRVTQMSIDTVVINDTIYRGIAQKSADQCARGIHWVKMYWDHFRTGNA